MKLCKDCKNRGKKHNCQLHGSTSNYAERCKDFEQRRPTNADHIRSMSNEELGSLLGNMAMDMVTCDYCPAGIENCHWDCKKRIVDWLQSEVEERNETD